MWIALLAFDESKHLRNHIFQRNRYHHAHMIRHNHPFFYQNYPFPRQPLKYLAKLFPDRVFGFSLVWRLAHALGVTYEALVILSTC